MIKELLRNVFLSIMIVVLTYNCAYATYYYLGIGNDGFVNDCNGLWNEIDDFWGWTTENKNIQKDQVGSEILSALDSYKTKLLSKDTFLFFYSGHGGGGLGDPPYGEIGVLSNADWCKDYEIANKFKEYPVDVNIAAIFDCCHAGDMVSSENDPDDLNTVNQIGVGMACQENESAYGGNPDSGGNPYSVYTTGLINAISNATKPACDNNNDGFVSVNEWLSWANNYVKQKKDFTGLPIKQEEQQKGSIQTPKMYVTPDYDWIIFATTTSTPPPYWTEWIDDWHFGTSTNGDGYAKFEDDEAHVKTVGRLITGGTGDAEVEFSRRFEIKRDPVAPDVPPYNLPYAYGILDGKLNGTLSGNNDGISGVGAGTYWSTINANAWVYPDGQPDKKLISWGMGDKINWQQPLVQHSDFKQIDWDISGKGILKIDQPYVLAGKLWTHSGASGLGYTEANFSDSMWLGITAAPVPEPCTILLLGTGIAGLAGIARRRRKEQTKSLILEV